MREHTIVRAGGVALIAGAVAFLGVFAFLAARFNYRPSSMEVRRSSATPYCHRSHWPCGVGRVRVLATHLDSRGSRGVPRSPDCT